MSLGAARPRRIGLAIGGAALTGVELRAGPGVPRPGAAWSFALDANAFESSLAGALASLREQLGAGRVVASVALLRPHARTKALAVPRLRRGPLRELLRRDARRWFVTGAEPALLDASPAARIDGGAVAAAVCAPAKLVESLLSAVAAAGFEVDRATAGAAALRLGLLAVAPDVGRGRVAVIAGEDEEGELLLLDRGRLRSVLPAPGGAGALGGALERMRASGSVVERVMVLAGEVPGEASLDALPRVPSPARPAAELAAFGAILAGERAPLLLTDAIRATRAAASRRRTSRVALAAGAVAVVAGALHLLALGRELDTIEVRRAEIAPAVARTAAARHAVESARATLDAMTELEGTGVRWTSVVAGIAAALPPSSWLESVSAEGAVVRIAGASPSADAIVSALEDTPLLSGVALAAPIRRDEADGLDRFEIVASLESGDTTRAMPSGDSR